ncbi:DnaA/Hda family protein [Gammaproteobacteria bacterium]|nr:DnaA/Hda family protein [Gammaproteobacteria bacterium]
MQQTLDLINTPGKTFDNFICDSNAACAHKLKFFLLSQDVNTCAIRGQSGYGRTHLLAAACAELAKQGQHACFISMKQPHKIESLIQQAHWAQLICIDDIQLATRSSEHEMLLFRLFNFSEQYGAKLLWSINCFDAKPFERKDLNSRFSSMLHLDLKPNTISEMQLILKHYALQSQIVISDEACALLLKEYTRNLSALISKLKEIDAYASSHKKKITQKICRDLIGSDLHQLDE